MYYRIAIRREGDHRDQPPIWQWKSTVLSSLNTLFQWFQFYRALPQDRLRVFSSSSREEINEQLMCENQGLGSNSVPAAQFLRERLIHVQEMTAEVSAHGAREQENQSPSGAPPNPCAMSVARKHMLWSRRACLFWRGNGEKRNGERGAITIRPTSLPSPARGRKSVPGCGSLRGYTAANYSHKENSYDHE